MVLGSGVTPGCSTSDPIPGLWLEKAEGDGSSLLAPEPTQETTKWLLASDQAQLWLLAYVVSELPDEKLSLSHLCATLIFK